MRCTICGRTPDEEPYRQHKDAGTYCTTAASAVRKAWRNPGREGGNAWSFLRRHVDELNRLRAAHAGPTAAGRELVGRYPGERE